MVSPLPAAQIAKATLQRLAQARLEPTPENYARAWAECGGAAAEPMLPESARPALEKLAARALPEDATAQSELVVQLQRGRWAEAARALEGGNSTGAAWAATVDALVRGLERGGRHWTAARKKDSLRRVLDGSRSDAQRLRERLTQLAGSWERDEEAEAPTAGVVDSATPEPPVAATGSEQSAHAAAPATRLETDLVTTLRSALPSDEEGARSLDAGYAAGLERLERDGPAVDLVPALTELNGQARDLFARRHHLVHQLGRLVRELTEGLTELAEDESWAQGQALALRGHLGEEGAAPTVRDVRAAGSLLAQTRRHQQALKVERDRARDALRALVVSLMAEVASVGGHADRFGADLEQYTNAVERASDPHALAALVREMLDKARAAQAEVSDSSARLAAGQAQAQALSARVQELEGELRRLSDEVSTDALTQVANRRGLQSAFEVECARSEREGAPLAVGLIDIDNFKRLNDSLGHAAGDQALQTLAAHVRQALRPADHVARLGGEEFVVLLPSTPVDEAREVLTRLQRALSGSLFMHEGRDVFVTFSAGVTVLRAGEKLEQALERADAAMYEAKRTGKNRTCMA